MTNKYFNPKEFIASLLTESELATFRTVEDLTPIFLDREDASCHTIVEALIPFVPSLETVRGTFGRIHEHSWLRFIDKPELIIDPYPVACLGGPILVTTNYMTPWKALYKEEK